MSKCKMLEKESWVCISKFNILSIIFIFRLYYLERLNFFLIDIFFRYILGVNKLIEIWISFYG